MFAHGLSLDQHAAVKTATSIVPTRLFADSSQREFFDIRNATSEGITTLSSRLLVDML